MTFKPLKDFKTKIQDLALVLSILKEWAKQLNDNPLLDGRLFQNLTISTSGKAISHNLGRVPKGWIIVRNTGSDRIWETGKDKNHLNLDCDGSTTFSIWIF